MDYTQAREAFFSPRSGPARAFDWSTPARRLRDAVEPLATICFWSEPAYDAYAARGLDFLTGYVWGRGSALGDAEPSVVAAAFGVFDPGAVDGLLRAGREAASLAEVRTAMAEGVGAAYQAVFGDRVGVEMLEETSARLRAAVEGLPVTGRPFFAGLVARPTPDDPWVALWHACALVREHRGDAHLAAVVAAGLDGLEANLLTERWVGWEPLSYTGSRAWTPEAMAAATERLMARGLVDDAGLTTTGRELRESLERTTDAAEQPIVDALGADLDALVERLSGWSQAVVDHGWFPPDPYKRVSG